jgi:uncharacterized protein (DUF427 family)
MDADLLTSTATATHCPDKVRAEYWSVRVGDTVHEDLAWSSRTHLPESQRIARLISIRGEQVDVCADGFRQDRPST